MSAWKSLLLKYAAVLGVICFFIGCSDNSIDNSKGTFFSIVLPSSKIVNGVTANVEYGNSQNQQSAGSIVNLRIIFNGSSSISGSFSVNLTSVKANLNALNRVKSVNTGESLSVEYFSFTMPNQNVDDLSLIFTFSENTYDYNIPDSITENGVTAFVNYDKEAPLHAGTEVTATVIFTGTAVNGGIFSINLTSVKAGMSGLNKKISVLSGNTPEPVVFNFILPDENVDDIILTFIPPGYVQYVVGYEDYFGASIWRISSNGKSIETLVLSYSGGADSIISVDGILFISGYERNTAKLWKVKDFSILETINLTDGQRTAKASSVVSVNDSIYIAGYERDVEDNNYIAKNMEIG